MEETKELPQVKPNSVDIGSDFHYTSEKYVPLSKLKKASYIMLPLALYQIFYGIISKGYSTGSFPTTLAINGIISVVLAFSILRWAGRRAQAEKEIFRANKDENEGPFGSSFVFITSLLESAASVVLLLNQYMQREYTNEYLVAVNSSSALWESNFGAQTLMEAERKMNLYYNIYALIQVAFMIYYASAADISFKYVKSDDSTMSKLVSISNLLLLSFSLGLTWMLGHAIVYDDNEYLAKLFPEWILKIQLTIAIMTSIFSFFVWVTNYTKSKAGCFILCVFLTFTLLGNMYLTGKAERSTKQVYNFYKDTSNSIQWTNIMSYVNQKELIKIGCPSKYLATTSCPNSLKAVNWEDTLSMNEENMQCLNTACAGLLGQLYSNEYLIITNLGLLSILANGLVLVGLYYFWSQRVETKEIKNPREWLFLGLMLLVASLFMLSKAAYQRPYIQQYPGDFKNIKLVNFLTAAPAINQYTSIHTQTDYYDQMFDEIMDFVSGHQNKYLILRVNETKPDLIYVYAKADIKKNYDDFYNEMKKINHGIGLVWIKVEHIERLFMTLYLSNSTSKAIKDAYLGGQDLKSLNYKDPEIGVVATTNITDLVLENAMQRNHHVFRIHYYENDDWYGNPSWHNDFEMGPARYFTKANNASSQGLHISLPTDHFDPHISEKFDDLTKNHAHKYVSTKVAKDGTVTLDKVGEKAATYLNFIGTLPQSDLRISLYDFQYEDRRIPVAVFWYIKGTQKDWISTLDAYAKSFQKAAVTILPTDSFNDLDLESFVVLGAIVDPKVRQHYADVMIKHLEDYWKTL